MKENPSPIHLRAELHGLAEAELQMQLSSLVDQHAQILADQASMQLSLDKLSVSEIRFRRLFEAAHDGVLLLDPRTRRITEANPFMTALLGYSREDLVGKELFEIGLLTDQMASKEMFQKLKKEGQVRFENLPLKSTEGVLREVEVVANLYQEDENEVIQCNIRDITVRKVAEDALREIETRLTLGMEVSGLALAEVDYVTDCQHLTAEAAQLFGLGNRALVLPRAVLHKMFHPDDELIVAPLIAASLDPASDGWLAMDHRIICPNGEVRWLRVREKVDFGGLAGERRPMHGTMALLDVTEEKKHAAALYANGGRLHLATEATSVGIWQWNLLTNEVHWDTQMFRIYGVTSTIDGIVPYDTWSQAVVPEDLPEQEEILRDTVRRQGQSTRNFRILRANDAACRHIQCVETVRANEASEAEWVVGTNLDVTEQKQAEERLLASSLRVKLGVQVAGLALADVDYVTGINHLSAEAARLYGLGSTAMIVPRETVHGTFHPDDVPELMPMIRESLNPKGTGWFSLDHRVIWPDGEIRWLRVRKQVYFEGEGDARHPVRATQAALDVTNEHHTTDMLRRNEALFSSLIQQAPVGIYMVDAHLRMQQVNPTAMPDFANISPLLGRNFAEIVHLIWPPKVALPMIACFRHTLATGEPYQAPDLIGKRRDIGADKVYEWSLQRVTLPDGENGVVCFYNDITARAQEEQTLRRLAVMTATNKRLEREIVRRQKIEDALKASQQTANELLIQSQQLQEQQRHLARQILIAQEEERKRVSRELHDVIAQSLTSINYRLAALQTQVTGNPADLQEKILQAQESVAQSVDTVHRFARDLRPSMLDDLGLMPALRSYTQALTQRTNLPIILTADVSVETLVSNARTVFYRIIQEALTNIVRHANATQIIVNIHQQGQFICLEITDNGVGFALETSKQNRLGLLGMKERVEMIGGKFSIQSKLGGPTAVRVAIPA